MVRGSGCKNLHPLLKITVILMLKSSLNQEKCSIMSKLLFGLFKVGQTLLLGNITNLKFNSDLYSKVKVIIFRFMLKRVTLSTNFKNFLPLTFQGHLVFMWPSKVSICFGCDVWQNVHLKILSVTTSIIKYYICFNSCYILIKFKNFYPSW